MRTRMSAAERARAYRKNNPGKAAAASRKYRKNNPGKGTENVLRYRKAHPDKYRESTRKISRKQHLKTKFGITVEDYAAKLLAQDGVCAICHKPETATRNGIVKQLAVDHNHVTGANRDLLCQKCNWAFGMLREDPTIIANMLAYARKYETK